MAKLDKQNVEDILSLIPIQEGMLFHYLKDPHSDEYFEQICLQMSGEINIPFFTKAWESVIQTNEQLRTLFRWEKVGAPVQIVLKEHKPNIEIINLQHRDEKEKRDMLETIKINDREKKFDLREVPFRITICKLAEEQYEMILSHHHILYDGWSNGIILKEFINAYQCLTDSETYKLPAKKKYKEFVKYLKYQDKDKQKTYWQGYLKGFDSQTKLETKKRTDQSIRNDRHYRIRLSKRNLEEFAQKHEVTLAALLYSLWGIVLQKNNNSDDIVFGSTISGRAGTFQGIEEMVGLFINTIPLRVKRELGETFAELVKSVNRATQDWEVYGHSSLTDIQRYSELDEKTDLFDTIVVFENYPLDQAVLSKKSSIVFQSFSAFEMTNYGLSISIHAFNDIEVAFSYNDQLYDERTIKRLAEHFALISEEGLKHPEKPVDQIEIVSADEKKQILWDFNDTERVYSSEMTIAELFEQQAAKTPNNVAVVDQDRAVTYKQLNEMSNSLANVLLKKGIKKGEIVAFITGHSIEMVAGMIGVLKAGAAYVPIDPEYPASRIRLMLQDSGARFVLTGESDNNVCEPFAEDSILYVYDSRLFFGETTHPRIAQNPNDLFAVFYTSGTTGKPKGVMIEHRSVVNLIQWFGETYEITEHTNLLQVTNYVFDPTIEDFFGTLLYGATLHIAEKDLILDKERFCDYVDQHQIHMINFIPTVLKELLCHDRKLTSLRAVISGGERLEELLKDEFIQRGYTLYNNYGPAETTVDALSVKCSEAKVSLGKPIANVRCYILDKDQNLSPIGVTGELYIAGAGVSRGYLNMPEATNENFMMDPFRTGDRMYKTGDLGRWLPNGEIEFLGRADHQVKIRGYRIELSEIHQVLVKLKDIQDAAIIDWELDSGKKVLCAYLIANEPIHVNQIREYVSNELPDYMVPAHYIQMDKLPLTSIGKLDRKKLPAPVIGTAKYVAPSNKIEEELVTIWSSVLGMEKDAIGIEDNFFELGGDSILSIQVAGKALQKDIEITVSQMFQYPTIAELAAHVEKKESTLGDGEEIVETGEVLLTPIQKWFFEQKLDNYHHWNQSVLLETQPGMKSGLLRESFQRLTRYHDSFRLRYFERNGEWVQSYFESHEHVRFDVHRYDETADSMNDVLSDLQNGLNITNGPLIRAAYFDFGDQQKGKLFITAHHLIVDGYSWRIMLDDLQAIYEQLINKRSGSLPSKSLSFKKWSDDLYEYARSDQLKDELGFWLENTPADLKPVPVDLEGGLNIEKSARTITQIMTEEETNDLLYAAGGNTKIDDILLSALSLTLTNWTGKTLVDLEGHGRQPLLKEHDLSRTVGWFTCVYPIVLGDMDQEKNMADVLKQVKERYRSVPNGGIGYEILFYLADKGVRDQIADKPRPQISFNYLGQFTQNLSKHSLFTLSEVNTGPARDPNGIRSHLLEIDCMVVEKKLSIEWKYSANSHLPVTIQCLASDFVDQLKHFIRYCKTLNQSYLTPSDFPLAIIDQKKLDELAEDYQTIEDIYQLSPVQQSMIFHHIYSPDSSVTVEQTVFSIESKLNVQVFERVWQTILERHESLRTSYHWEGLDEPVQMIHKHCEVPFQFLDWTTLSEDSQKLEQLIADDRKKGFDLSKPPLMRILVIKRSESSYEVIWTHHHLQLDGWCNSILFKEIGMLYEAYCKGETINLGKARSFKDYINWLRRQDTKKAEQYWRKTLEGFKTPIRFQTIFPVKEGTESAGFGNVAFDVSQETQQQIQSFARMNRVTLNTLIQGAWAILLNRYSEEIDITFGVTSSGRPADLKGSDSMIGCFMNTLPFRVTVNHDSNLITWLKRLQWKQAEMRQFEYTSLADIRSWSDMPRNSPLFDLYESIVIVENYPFDASLKDGIGPLQVKSIQVEEQMDYPLVVYCNLQPELHFKLLFDHRFLDETEANQILSHFVHILSEMIGTGDSAVGSILMISEKEHKSLLTCSNPEPMDYPKDLCFHDLFAARVQLRSDHPAILQNGERLSYKELDILSNKLAHRLIKLGVGPDIPVGMYVERSIKMAVGIVGILKAGGAFLPIDADYPGDRVNMMLTDARVPVLLTDSVLSEKVRGFQGRMVFLDTEWESVQKEPEDQPLSEVKSKNLAYVIYTSGSSGKPKGVMMPHEAVVSHSIDLMKRYELTPEDRVLQFSSISFDISLEQIFTTLAAGSALVLRDKQIWTPHQFSQKCMEYGLSVVNLPTSYWGEIVQEWQIRPKMIPEGVLRLVIVGGEQMSAEKVGVWESLPLNDITLLNAYGPAETAMTSTLYHVSGKGTKSAGLRFIPVGKPLANRRIYILDEQMRPQPIGVKGEIYIGGIPLARGYLNKPEMTRDKFIQDPYYHGYGDRLYKTGDLGKRLADGNIEVLGRKDDQIKVRGHRIDIGEIEVVLNRFDPIKDTVVIAKHGAAGEMYLAAYYVAAALTEPSNIRNFLRQKLPEYMIPSFFIQLDQFPLSPNGKIDRRALATKEIESDIVSEYEIPINDTQLRLVHIWERLLKTDRIGITHHFFEIGGQSLKAITLVSEIHREFDVELPLVKIFEGPTIKELSVLIEEMTEKKATYQAIQPVEEKEYYPMSAAQKRMYIVSQLEGAGTNYNITGAVMLSGNVDVQRIEEAFQALVDRHESLRTTFEQADGQIIQRIHQNVEWSMQHFYANEQNLEHVVADFIQPFDLKEGPLFRAAIVEMSPSRYVLVYDMHHIVSDGLSIAILINEFVSLYQKNSLPEVRIQYKDFAAWQNNKLESGLLHSQEEYWLQTFAGEIPLLDLPTDYRRIDKPISKGGSVTFDLESHRTSQLMQISNETGVTLYSVLLSAFNVLLSKYSGQEDIVVGTPVAGRLHAELEHVVGMFVNTLALRNYPDAKKAFDIFVKEAADQTVQALEHQEYPFEVLVDKLQLQKNGNRHPLFDVMFAFENVDEAKANLKDFEITPYEYTNRTTKFDLELKVTEQEGNLHFIFEYRTGLFQRDTIERMAEHFVKIIEVIIADITVLIGEIDLVTEEEKNKIIAFNDTDTMYKKEIKIKSLFEEQVVKYPQKRAVVFGQRELTYKELNEKANQLARYLIKKGAGPNRVIGLLAEPSIEMVVGLWGIMKSGAAYLPIDPEFPDERIKGMIEDSGAIALLTQSHLLHSKNNYNVDVIELDMEAILAEDISNPENNGAAHDTLYIIYTSGTTGTPKGVPIKNQSLVNYISWFTRVAEITSSAKTMLLSSFAFDLGYTSLYSALLNGGELHIAPKECYTVPEKLLAYLIDQKISYIKLTPSLFSHLINARMLEDEQYRMVLKLVVLGGEEVRQADIAKFNRLYPDTEIMNHYGPTEATIGSIAHKFNFANFDNQRIIIGKPIDNAKIFILDKDQKPVPIGVPGEICISGTGLSEGYLNQPQLTKEKFIETSIFGQKKIKLYKTGDIGRFTSDGEIEFIGRMDHQVKIRGYRVEPGEVTTILLQHHSVKDAIVVPKDDILYAYLVLKEGENGSGIRDHLLRKIPYYMMPSCFIRLDQIPLTPNGKLDRTALPEKADASVIDADFEWPKDSTDQKIAQIWEEILEVEQIGLNHSFFEMGGNSLKLMIVTGEIQKEFNVTIPLRESFKAPTVKGMSEFVKNASESIYFSPEPLEKHKYYELSSAQKRLYALSQMEGIGTSYNMPRATLIEGEINLDKLEEAFVEMINRHEALRTSFEVIEGEPNQRIHEKSEFTINYAVLDQNVYPDPMEEMHEGWAQLIDQLIQPFDLKKAPLARVFLFRLGSDKHVMLTDMHHLVSDGYSVDIMLQELLKIYQGHKLPDIHIQYKEFAGWQSKFLKTEIARKQEEYWLDVLTGDLPVLNLPTDFPRPEVQSYEGDSVIFETSEELKKRLDKLCLDTDTTLYMILSAAYSILLSKYSSQDDIIVGTPILGRTHPDFKQTIGLFANTIAIRSFPKREKSFAAFLTEMKEHLHQAYENQDYQIDMLIDQLHIKREPGRNPIFSTMFAYQEGNDKQNMTENIKMTPIEYRNKMSKFDFTLFAEKGKETIIFEFEYASQLYKKETINKFAKDFQVILETICTDREIKLKEIEIEGLLGDNTEIENVTFQFLD
ncbi:amino acid adenylation domain-containing protein [Bacillus capparidis]|uniref:Amino acid adenylation domain-containing protein/non-ribosomal peptide synthase protein (TIGR01720 family) n=1 Tax=Bacillus capparidis TaxID=1840411 RepID=A0ABS4CRF7_9BACI|nr:non-ribosomal peptide synthetase [Bacillus capparidis]MBP1080163.1 amino acid adenylation domain-containing protein/non-ribosomal peptide synthase protein (TIGR01720 family) [Bacillus capparidis]MED1095544.1 amino acid adenylation domain-containing protein [Bacillus capparidis]